MLKLFGDLARKIAVTLMALSLIVAANSNVLMGHAEAAAASCNGASQTVDKLKGQAPKGEVAAVVLSALAKTGELSKSATGSDSNGLNRSCCALVCSPMVAMPPQSEILNRPAAMVVWESRSSSLSPVFQDGLRRPPRQPGNV